MQTKRLREIHGRLVELLHGVDSAAVHSQLRELDAEIKRLKLIPETHVDMAIVGTQYRWQNTQTLAYKELWVREDGAKVYRIGSMGSVYYGFLATGDHVKKTDNRRRYWKHAKTAMAYIDRDHPVKGVGNANHI